MPSALTNFIFFLALNLFFKGSTSSKLIRTSCINHDCSATRLTLHNPPINLFDRNVISELNSILKTLEQENQTKVIVVSSDIPGFFAAQIDLNILGPDAPQGSNSSTVVDQYYDNLNRLLSSPIIFIAEVNGRAWGAGDEHLLRMDMRFAGPEAQFGAPEAAVGLIHVGGLQQLVRLIGPGLTAEYMLSAAQVQADEAARIGWVNSVYDSAEALRSHVDGIAARISLFPFETLRVTKASIAEQGPSLQILQRDRQKFDELSALPFVSSNVAKILELSSNQSLTWELDNNDNIVKYLY